MSDSSTEIVPKKYELISVATDTFCTKYVIKILAIGTIYIIYRFDAKNIYSSITIGEENSEDLKEILNIIKKIYETPSQS